MKSNADVVARETKTEPSLAERLKRELDTAIVMVAATIEEREMGEFGLAAVQAFSEKLAVLQAAVITATTPAEVAESLRSADWDRYAKAGLVELSERMDRHASREGARS